MIKNSSKRRPKKQTFNDIVTEQLENRFSHAVTEISVTPGYEGLEELWVCRDSHFNDALVVKKVGLEKWRGRVEREASVYKKLNKVEDWQKYMLPLIASWHVKGKFSCLIIPYMPLGSLGESIASGNVIVSVQTVDEWIEQANEALTWLHDKANFVHTDTKTDNFMLVDESQRIVLFDFDECWSRSQFIGDYAEQNFTTLKRYDLINFLYDLQNDLVRQRDSCDCRSDVDSLDSENDSECYREEIFDECAMLVGNYSRSDVFITHAHEREALRGSLIGTEEEIEWLGAADTFNNVCSCPVKMSDKGNESNESNESNVLAGRNCEKCLRRLRLQLADESEVLHLGMQGGSKMMI